MKPNRILKTLVLFSILLTQLSAIDVWINNNFNSSDADGSQANPFNNFQDAYNQKITTLVSSKHIQVTIQVIFVNSSQPYDLNLSLIDTPSGTNYDLSFTSDIGINGNSSGRLDGLPLVNLQGDSSSVQIKGSNVSFGISYLMISTPNNSLTSNLVDLIALEFLNFTINNVIIHYALKGGYNSMFHLKSTRLTKFTWDQVIINIEGNAVLGSIIDNEGQIQQSTMKNTVINCNIQSSFISNGETFKFVTLNDGAESTLEMSNITLVGNLTFNDADSVYFLMEGISSISVDHFNITQTNDDKRLRKSNLKFFNIDSTNSLNFGNIWIDNLPKSLLINFNPIYNSTTFLIISDIVVTRSTITLLSSPGTIGKVNLTNFTIDEMNFTKMISINNLDELNMKNIIIRNSNISQVLGISKISDSSPTGVISNLNFTNNFFLENVAFDLGYMNVVIQDSHFWNNSYAGVDLFLVRSEALLTRLFFQEEKIEDSTLIHFQSEDYWWGDEEDEVNLRICACVFMDSYSTQKLFYVENGGYSITDNIFLNINFEKSFVSLYYEVIEDSTVNLIFSRNQVVNVTSTSWISLDSIDSSNM